ncbi:MAG: hypothetical protein AAF152_02405 [Cyanobacteria bacterium P01_A01_bin.114]
MNSPIPTGLDVGNASTKLVLGDLTLRTPSYLLEVTDQPRLDRPSEGYFRYVEGDRPSLTGRAFLVGEVAHEQAPVGLTRVSDDDTAKVNTGLEMLLGALSHLPHQAEWPLDLVASIHHSHEDAEGLTQALQGAHRVQFNRHDAPVVVNIRVLKVVNEGAGAIVAGGLTSAKTLLYDLGNGTTITTIFGSKGRLIDRAVRSGGVEDLIDSIARDPQVISQLHREGDRAVVRKALEDGSLVYGSTGFSLEAVYKAALKTWAGSVVKDALASGRRHEADAASRFAIGGGCLLPGLGQALAAKGVTIASDPVFINARGLCKLASLLAAQVAA